MINKNNEEVDKPIKSKKEEKTLAKNTFYSFLQSYSNYIFSIITVFFIARLIPKEEWDFLILTTSLINIFSLILIFLPPSLGLSILFYASKFKALNQNNKLKSFIKNSLILKFFFIIVIFFLSIIIFNVFIDFFSLNLKNYYYLFYLLSPLIIINGLNPILINISQSLNLFNLNYILLVIKNILYIGGLTFLFFITDLASVYNIGLILIISTAIPFILHFTIIVLILQFKIKKTGESIVYFKETIKKIYKYGSYLTVIDFIGRFNTEMKIQLVGFFEVPSTVVGYNIANRYNSIPTLAYASFSRPLTIYYIRLINNNQMEQIKKIYNLLFNYSLILFLLITGILFFSVDIFLFILYGESYLTFSMLLKLMLFLPLFSIQNTFLDSYFMASNKVKPLSVISLAIGLFKLAFFAIGIIFFDIVIAVIFAIVVNIINLLIYTLILNKFNIKLKIKKSLIIFLSFFISVFTATILNIFFLNDIYLIILNKLNLSFLQYFSLPGLCLYLIIFICMIIIFKIITHSDIESIESIFIKDSLPHRIIRKGLKISKKLVRA
ncbi:MAG: lipopolysaccharide biosynthesis protein [Promethearchaeota archaeon]